MTDAPDSPCDDCGLPIPICNARAMLDDAVKRCGEVAVLDALGLVRADLAATLPAPVVKPLAWEALPSSHCYRAAAPLFGSIRVERYGGGPWFVNWSVPGYSASLVEGGFATDVEAMDAAEAHVLSALTVSPTPVEALVEALRDCCDELEREGSRPAHRTRTAHRARAALAAYEGERKDG